MIKISFKFFIALSLISSYVIADDFRAKAKFKPQYPKSAYVKRISGYAVVDFEINEKGRTEKQSISSAKCFNLIDKNGNYFINVGEESLPIDLDELKRKSEVIFKANPEIEVVFQSDRNVAFDFVAKAMASVQSVGITKVGIVTSGYEN